MRIVRILAFSLTLPLFISCQQNHVNRNSTTEPFKTTAKKSKPKIIKEPYAILNSTTGYVDYQLFTITCMSDENLFILDAKKDTIYQDSVYSPHQEFVDFDGDGYKDILIEYMTNVPGIIDILLYDKAERTYKQIVDLQNFPDPHRIPHSNYYYSYHRSGCADMNWDSDLFYIKDYKTVKIGNISGNQCGDRDIKDGISISKIAGEKRTPFLKLPINTIKHYKNYKWGFIEHYWRKNYKKFL